MSRFVRIGDSTKRFADDVVGRDGGTKKLGCNFRDSLFAIQFVAAGHGGGRADALQSLSGEGGFDPAHQQSHIGALSSAIGVKLIQDKKPQPGTVTDDLFVDGVLPRHQVFEHDEVGQQDVRRIVGNDFTHRAVFLPGIAREGNGFRRYVLEKLLQFLHLAVCQRVHRVNDDGSSARRGIGCLLAQDRINDRDKEA